MSARAVRRGVSVWIASFLLVASCGSAGADLPRDPQQTLEHVENGRMRVGLVEHPPWVIRTGGEPAGAEVELVRALAKDLQSTPEWHWGGEQSQMEALERYELDLVIGGLTKKTPWSKTVGLTSPYFEDRLIVGVPQPTAPPESIKGMRITARKDEALAALIEGEGAKVLRVDDLKHANGPVAASEWEIEQLGLTPTQIELTSEKHVMAAPPGENGWIKKLDEFLYRHRDKIKKLLQQENLAR